MPDNSIDETVRYLHEILAQLRQDHERAIKPIIDQLVAIESLRAPRGIRVPVTDVILEMIKKAP